MWDQRADLNSGHRGRVSVVLRAGRPAWEARQEAELTGSQDAGAWLAESASLRARGGGRASAGGGTGGPGEGWSKGVRLLRGRTSSPVVPTPHRLPLCWAALTGRGRGPGELYGQGRCLAGRLLGA